MPRAKIRKNSPVVDACIARSSSSNSNAPIAQISHDCLEAIREVSIKITMTKSLLGEWKKHKSRYSQGWLASMITRKLVDIVENEKLHNSFVAQIHKPKKGKEKSVITKMKKDLHLFCAAIESDEIIISYNDIDARHFKNHITDARIRKVHWINPERKTDIVSWIKSGLPHHDDYKLKNLSL